MAQLKKLIPFWLTPYSWGMAGKTRQKAEAEYYYDGFELETILHELDKETLSDRDYLLKLAFLEHKYGKCTRSEYMRRCTNLIEDQIQKALAINQLDYDEKLITKNVFEKQEATLKNEPWVNVLELNFGGDKSLEGSFSLDWNDVFVKKLESEGYQGATAEHVVNHWFMEVCKNVALEEFDGVGNFNKDVEANFEALKRWSKP